jgi:transcriptional regulator with XRE-family HTH domain
MRETMIRQVTQKEIAEIAGIHPATVSKILNRESTDYTSIETRQRVFALAMELGYDFTQLKSVQRAQTRKPVDLQVRVTVTICEAKKERQEEIKPWDEGSGRLRDISLSGALISDLALPRNALPLQPFRLKLILEQGSLSGIEIPCQVVRLSHTGSREGENKGQTALGLKFETVPEETRNRLAELCSNCLTASSS